MSKERYPEKNQNIFLHGTEEQLKNSLVILGKYEDYEDYEQYAENENIRSFHPRLVRTVIRDDDYYIGGRANHFILIYGYSETLAVEDDEKDLQCRNVEDCEKREYCPMYGECVMSIINHKGILRTMLHRFV